MFTRCCAFYNYAHQPLMVSIQGMQKSGSPTIERKYNTWKLFKRKSIASYTRAAIRAGWPVVVGTHEGSIFRWHYPVATKYRSRTHKWRRCIKIFRKKCFRWHSETQYQMFTHQGSGTKTLWRDMRLHYAAYAKY